MNQDTTLISYARLPEVSSRWQKYCQNKKVDLIKSYSHKSKKYTNSSIFYGPIHLHKL